MSNRDDLNAIHDYVMNRSAPVAGAPAEVVRKWESLRAQWQGWYPKVSSSFYISDSDLANGRAIRNALMQNQNPDAWHYVQETAADKPGRAPYAQRPDAPVPSKEPWKRKGLTYSGKYRSRADVIALQQRINAAGYVPPLKVDGKYGPGTQAGERWLSMQGDKVQAAAKDAARDLQPAAKKAPPAEHDLADHPTATASRGMTLLGIPVNVNTLLGSAAGLAGGFAVGGPIGAAIGVPVGFLGAAKLFAEKTVEKVVKK